MNGRGFMEAPEVPTEHLHEEMHHHAEHAGEGERWVLGVALSSAIIAGFAAVAALLAGVNANNAMISQMQASDLWNYYQAKGIKASVLSTRIELLSALGKAANPKDQTKLGEYKRTQKEIYNIADKLQGESRESLETHETFARGVTLFQVAIAIAAVSVLAKRRKFWYVGMAAAVIGIGFLVQGYLRMRTAGREAEEVERQRVEILGGEDSGGGGEVKGEKKPGAAKAESASRDGEGGGGEKAPADGAKHE